MNLAVTLAMTGTSVGVVDADGQAPVLSGLVAPSEPELGPIDSFFNPALVDEFARSTDVPNLTLLRCGKASLAAALKSQSDALSVAMSALRAKYSYVIVDAGPVLGNSDALTFASLCTATVLVLHSRRTDLDSAAVATRLLNQYGAEQVVAIVNALPDGVRRKYFKNQRRQRVARRETNPAFQAVSDHGAETSWVPDIAEEKRELWMSKG
jgi:Mrp family chromosome partitioning ATPase